MSALNSVPNLNLKMNPFLVEVVHDVDEFKSIVGDGRKRYELSVRGDGSGIRFYVVLKVYGVAREGHVAVLEIVRKVDGLSLRGDKSIEEAVRESLKELTSIAKSLDARPGRFEVGMK